MKTAHFSLLFFLIFTCCSSKQTKVAVVKKEQSIKERLHNYFYYGDKKPAIIFNNVEYNHNQPEVAFLNHKIQWISSKEEDENGVTKIKIDDDIFTYQGKMTLNNVEGTRKDDVGFAIIGSR